MLLILNLLVVSYKDKNTTSFKANKVLETQFLTLSAR